MSQLRKYLVALLLSTCFTLHAQNPSIIGTFENTPEKLTPFLATYSLIANHFNSGFTSTTELSSVDGKQWNMHFEIDSMMVKLNEKVSFTWNNCYSRPDTYSFEFEGFGISRYTHNEFDWTNFRAVSKLKKKQLDFVLSPTTSDPLSFSMMVVCDLQKQAKDFYYHIASKGSVYKYNLKVIGEEKLKTPSGTYDTIKIQRIYSHTLNKSHKKKYPVTYFWVAPELGFFLVKMEQIQNRLLSGALVLKSLKTNSLTLNKQEQEQAPLASTEPTGLQ